MSEYQVTSRYFGIKENTNLIQTDLIVLNTEFTETTVRKGEQNNPEILSQRIYNNPHYWWVSCQYNGIVDPDNIPLGMKIKYPKITVPPREGL